MGRDNKGKAAVPRGKRRKKADCSGKALQKAILQAAAAAGAEFGEDGLVSYLQRQALAAPSPFLTLLGKALAENEDASAAPVRVIELVPAGAEQKIEEKEN